MKKLFSWFFEPEKKPAVKKPFEKDVHEHCWSNWELERDDTHKVSRLGNSIGQYRVLQQRRTCGLCGYVQIDVQRFEIGNVDWVKDA